LNDWDLSKNVRADGANPRQPDRTGTWQFMSAALLISPSKIHEVSDDLESFVHVLVYESVRFLKHDCQSVEQVMKRFFDYYEYESDGEAAG
ncbi:hypothetical protein NEOLEDRAFT_1045978, partial [Neolentinus lepideus HHB14362 ss-1]